MTVFSELFFDHIPGPDAALATALSARAARYSMASGAIPRVAFYALSNTSHPLVDTASCPAGTIFTDKNPFQSP